MWTVLEFCELYNVSVKLGRDLRDHVFKTKVRKEGTIIFPASWTIGPPKYKILIVETKRTIQKNK